MRFREATNYVILTPMESHKEEHSKSSVRVRDIVIGMSDGLTVPFALAAGLAGAVGATSIIVTAGLAEIAAGSISMGLGGYLAAKSEADHYAMERKREEREIEEKPEAEAREVMEILHTYGLAEQESTAVVNALRTRKEDWTDFMMRFELGLEEPDRRRAVKSAITIAFSYLCGGFIPLLPYMFLPDAVRGLKVSVGLTLLALAIFGYLKGRYTTDKPLRSMVQTVIIGGLAAGAAFVLAKLIA